MSDKTHDTPARQRLRAAMGRLALAEAVQEVVKADDHGQATSSRGASAPAPEEPDGEE